MGFIQDQLKKLSEPIIKATIAELKKSDSPKVTEVPTQMQIGYSYTGGAKRKYGSMVDFDSLRTFSVVYDVARVCINHRKRQINNLEWNIVPKDDKADHDKFTKRIETLTTFFEEPMPGMDFKVWVDRLLEDVLVLDAGVLWKDRTFGGKTLGLLPIDGSTIRLKVEEDGTVPIPPEVAFQQIIWGQVHGEYTTDEMYYKIMNPRTTSPYGLSPLECLVIGVDAALRSQMSNSALLSEGTVPEGFLSMPDTWNPEQIKDFQMWFDTLLAGNFNQNSRIKMIPGGKGIGYIPTKKAEDMRMLDFEKWLLMKTCAMFDVQPRDIGFELNSTPGNGDSQQELGNQRGLVPMANFLKGFFTQIISKDFGMSDLKFEWKGLQVIDDQFEMDRAKLMIEHGAMTINEMRIDQGLDPLEHPSADEPMIYATGGPQPLIVLDKETEQALLPPDQREQQPEPIKVNPDGSPFKDPNGDGTAPGAVKDKPPVDNKAKMELDEIEKWESMVLNYMKRDKGLPDFKASFIDKSAVTLINARLSIAKSKDEVKVAFKPFKEDAQERSLISEALSVSAKISGFKRNKYERVGSGTQ
jgi:hypothetical protein